MKWIDTLIKLRKDSVEAHKRELIKVQSVFNEQEKKMQYLQEEFRNIAISKASNGAMLQQFSLQRSYSMRAIKEQQNLISNLARQLQNSKEALLEANKELEQAKYMKADYLKKQLNRAKQIEQKRLDELASQRFYNNQKTAVYDG